MPSIFRSKFGMVGSKRSPVRLRTVPWWWVRWFAEHFSVLSSAWSVASVRRCASAPSVVVGCAGLLGHFSVLSSAWSVASVRRCAIAPSVVVGALVCLGIFRSKFGVPANARSDEQRLGRAMNYGAPLRQVGEVRAPARAGERPFRCVKTRPRNGKRGADSPSWEVRAPRVPANARSDA